MQDLFKFLEATLPEKPSPDQIEVRKLFGQASSRQYFRVFIKTQPQKSYVVMVLPKGFSSPAEEITKIREGAPKEFSFLNIQKYLLQNHVPVPEIFGFDANKGFVLLQDLGDQSLERLIKGAEGEFFLFYYKKAIDLLLTLQRQTFGKNSQECVAFYRNFEPDLLNWEFDHFLEYGIEDAKQIRVLDSDKKNFFSETRRMTEKITKMPQDFVHRDFQSRNIFCHGYDFFLIDFQDALLGPVLYDLAALLRDSYILIPQDFLSDLLKYYSDHLWEGHPYFQKESQLKNDFLLLTLQRKMKDYGRFQYIHTVRGNPHFLEHMPLTLVYIKLALDELEGFEDLKSFFAEYFRELRGNH